MSVVFFMRHADRDGAPGFDDPINDAGRARAASISWNCDLAVVSNLRRTRQTLEASNVKYRYMLQSELCREHLDGASHNQLPGEVFKVESHEELLVRVAAFREVLRRLATGFGSILVVTHATFMWHFLGLDHNVGYCEWQPWREAP